VSVDLSQGKASGADGDDVLTSMEGVIGSEFADTLSGDALDNFIRGRKGDDVIDGGGGIDIAQYLGARANHAVTILADRVTVRDNAGDAGLDTLYEVERLEFADQRIAVDLDGNAGQAYRVYKAAFDRQPDIPGLSYWIHQLDLGYTMLDAATGFIGSDEFRGLYGQNPTNQEYTLALYQNVLDRAPDQAGYDYWNAVLNGDPLIGQTTREQMLVDFSESLENKANVLPLIDDGIRYELWVT
jgi:hypothetical protein